MKLYTKAGELAIKRFSFPDGQSHVHVQTIDEFREGTIEVTLGSPSDLFEVLLLADVMRGHGYRLSLDVRYLLGARMDRAIDVMQPFTLQTVARIINQAGFTKVRILDPHSPVALRLIHNSSAVLPHAAVAQVFNLLPPCLIVVPDAGALERVTALAKGYRRQVPLVECEKHRDQATGHLSDARVKDPSMVVGQDCLILDDICDGGRTYVNLAKVLHACGARHVYLFVTHGIFSHGNNLDGLARIFTTDSYKQYFVGQNPPVVIPVSMREMTDS